MIVAGCVVDVVDGINNIHNILHRNALVRTQHHSSLVVVADASVDEVGELGFVGGRFIHEILVLLVDIDRDSLFGHGLAVA